MQQETINFSSRVKWSGRVARFMQMMANRLSMGTYRHGGADGSRACDAVQDYAHRIQECLDEYRSAGNTEELLSVANYACLEFLTSSHPNAHFWAADSNGRRVRE
jgi:hypothetical protein